MKLKELDENYSFVLKCLKNEELKKKYHDEIHSPKKLKYLQDINTIINIYNINIKDLSENFLLEKIKEDFPEILSHQKKNSPYYGKKICVRSEEKEKVEFYLITKYYNDLFLCYDSFCCNKSTIQELNTESDVEKLIEKLTTDNYSQSLELKEIIIPMKDIFNYPNYIYINKILIDDENYNKFIP